MDLELAHMAHVKQAGGSPNGGVFLCYSTVFNGHFPAAKWN
jgi:hypothetical protein